MKKHIITSSLAILASCTMTFAQFGGFDFGGGGGAGSGSLSSYTNKQNIDYVGDNHVGHKLDIYYPNDGKATHNVIIHIYGSAWGSNDSKGSADHGTVGKAALDAGYIFVTPNHRTYNDALWPAQINDIKAVVRYLRGNKEELKIDDSFIGISGFSSGGHLASMMGVTNGETVVKVGSESVDIEGKLGKFTSESSRVDAVCDWSGPVDCRDKSCGNPINMSPENDMVGGCGPQQCPDKHASLGTNTYIDANDVPHMICHGTTDNIVPCCEGEKYANNLKKAGIYVEWYNPGHGHQVNGDYTDEMIKFFNKIRSEKGEQGGGEEQGGGQQGGGEEQGGGQQSGGEEQGGGQQGGGSTTNCVDPCSYKTKYSGGKSVSSNGVQDVGNGYNLEMWRDGNSGGMTVFGGKADCAFKANWNNSGDYLARVGYYDGSAKKKYTDLGEIYAVYNYKKSGNGGGSYSYIGVYGWTKNPLIEYYIVDDSFTPNGGGMFWGANNKGTYTVDGVTYTLKVGQRNNAPSIEGTSTFQQVFAVRSSYQTCGTINVTEHFKNWEKLGVKMGGIYDCKILCEVGGGSGSIEYTCASMSWKGQNSSLGDLSCSEGGSQGGGQQGGGSEIVEQKPYKEAISIPGTLEGEHYDIGGNGNAYKDSDDDNEGDAKFRTDEGVDIVKGGTGMAVGYTTSSEWLEYTVDVAKTSTYDLTANASNGGGEINFDVYIDDAKVASFSGDKTSSWDTYTALTATTKEIKAGKHVLKVKFESNNNNLDYIKFVEHDGSSQQGGGGQGGGSHSGNCVDPCTYTSNYSGGKSVSSNGVQDVGNGYNLEMWRDGNSGGMTVFGGKADCAFKANWNNSGDYLARVGYYDGSAKKKYTDLGEIYAVYNYKKSGNGGGSYSYIGVYGWTKNPLIEYYIVDDSFTPNGGGMFWGANNKGTYTVDGVTYTLKVGQRNNAPSIEGTSTFQQVFAVRSSYQTCGTINVTEHFKNWEKLGVKMGGIYDCKILCEVGGGSGSIEYTCASMSWKGQNSSLGDLSCSDPTDVITINNESKEFAIVPNPASTEIYIISDGEVENVMIFNTIGDVVARADESRVDVSSLPTGIYFVKATIDGESVVKKLVVTK